jgi:4-hydroxy-3-methylbut-2-enyl diphosphate reductase
LEKLAIEAGCPVVWRVNGPEELPGDLVGTIGVTAGASAPEELVEAIISRLAPRDGVEVLRVTEEDEYFPPPRNIRDLQSAIGIAAAAMSGGRSELSTLFDDRSLAASDVLATLVTS